MWLKFVWQDEESMTDSGHCLFFYPAVAQSPTPMKCCSLTYQNQSPSNGVPSDFDTIWKASKWESYSLHLMCAHTSHFPAAHISHFTIIQNKKE